MTDGSDNRAGTLRVVGFCSVFLAIGTVAMLAKPQWREFFGEALVVLGVLTICRATVVAARRRFAAQTVSPFEWALRRERTEQTVPSQLATAISMASLPNHATFELLAAAVNRRLYDLFGYGLDDERARVVLGPDVYDVLLARRIASPMTSYFQRRRSFAARYMSPVRSTVDRLARLVHGDGSGTPASAGQHDESINQVRMILNRLETL